MKRQRMTMKKQKVTIQVTQRVRKTSGQERNQLEPLNVRGHDKFIS
jgi:hypothetical protein